MRERDLKKIGILFCVVAALCFLGSCSGMLWLYINNYPSSALLPHPIVAMLLGVFTCSILAMFCFLFAKQKPPRGGKRRKAAIATAIITASRISA
ncbi:DUF2975 domain-containing protein [Iodobacter sp. HSC-16F04]|uniref:DUF2975 domain-containing protein n=1 Tax=Iodobacter violaceini TaxID=3044271 RepID=A0ABX0KX47_9NEIS|nr:DUF2975 domain-containing protein [Iodobacter violacea]NHQ86787.1 DUF2975 domain-containing protein [Iodobacter violacea]